VSNGPRPKRTTLLSEDMQKKRKREKIYAEKEKEETAC